MTRGFYGRGDTHRTKWFAEVAVLAKALTDFAPRGDILELACGTGWWTEQLVRYRDSLTAVDASPEVIAVNRVPLPSSGINYVQADLFNWRPERNFDTVFFSFWLSHVPPERFGGFWETVKACLNPGGRVFLIDSSYTKESPKTKC